MIALKNLRLTYPGAATPALDGLDLDLAPGRIFGLLGPNGAGKSTLMSILAGLRRPDSGEVYLDGHAPRSSGAPRVGYVPQTLAFYPALTVRENLQLFATLSGGAPGEVAEALASMQLEAHAGRRAQQLSGGLQRRLNFAIGLLGTPRILLLDEPTVGIDPQSRHFIFERARSLRDRGLTIVYTSHQMDEIARLCEDLAILDHGRCLAHGTLAGLLAQGDADLEALFLRLTRPELRDAA